MPLTHNKGFESGTVSSNFDSLGNSGTGLSLDTAQFNKGAQSLKMNYSSSFGWGIVSMSGLGFPQIIVIRAYVRLASLPSQDADFFRIRGGGGSNLAYFGFHQATGKFYTYLTSYNDGPTFNASQWYRVDLKLDCSTGTRKLDWQIDGVAQTQVTTVTAAVTLEEFNVGDTSARTWNGNVDDLAISLTGSDYPIGPAPSLPLNPSDFSFYRRGDILPFQKSNGSQLGMGIFRRGEAMRTLITGYPSIAYVGKFGQFDRDLLAKGWL